MCPLVIDFDGEAEIADHAPDLVRRSTRRCEVSIDEYGVRRIQRQRLQAAQIVFATAGDADFRTGMKETKETEDFQATLRCQVIALLQGRAGHRVQRIHGNGIRPNVSQSHREVDKVIIGTRGIDPVKGLTNDNMEELITDQAIFSISKNIIVVADHSKFGRVAAIRTAPATAAAKIVTNAGGPKDILQTIRQMGVQIIEI